MNACLTCVLSLQNEKKTKLVGKARRAALREDKKKAVASRALVTRAKEKVCSSY